MGRSNLNLFGGSRYRPEELETLPQPLGFFRLCIPHLRKTKGNIVNNSSVAGLRPIKNGAYCCMSKAALDMFTQCLALELAPDGVRVNSVNPAVIETENLRNSGLDEEALKQLMEKCKQIHPLGRAGTAVEVANVIAFLASREASFMTGALVPVCGGASCSDPFK